MRKHPERARTREHGCQVFVNRDGYERVGAFRRVVASRSYALIDGIAVDLTTAHLVTSIYDHLSPFNQERYRDMPTDCMIEVAYQIHDKQASGG